MKRFLTFTISLFFLGISTLFVYAQMPASCLADIDRSGVVDLTDYSILVNNFLKNPFSNPRADINSDGRVDLTDYSLLVSSFLKPANCPTSTPVVSPTATPTLGPTATPVPISNLLQNPSFEQDFANWSAGSGLTIVTGDTHAGVKAAKDTGGTLSPNPDRISGSGGKTYKVTAWMKINSGMSCTGDCWGGFQMTGDNSIGSPTITDPGYITPSSFPVNQWFKVAMTISANSNWSTQLKFRPFGGTGWQYDVLIDDVAFFEVPAGGIVPVSSFTPSTTTATQSTAVTFTNQSQDADGAIRQYFWDFGDGSRSNDESPSHTYISNGTFVVNLGVADDTNNYAESQKTIVVDDANFPSIVLTNPPVSTTNPQFTISGSATPGNGASLSKVVWFSDRGVSGTAIGTNSWQANLDLTGLGGVHFLTFNAYDSNNHVVTKTVTLNYQPTAKVSITNSSAGVTQNASSVEQYSKFEATFQLNNSVAKYPGLPYESSVAFPGLRNILKKGITVNAVFTAPSGKTFTQPGFLYQDFTSSTSLIANGTPVWKVRFAPNELGNWTYSLSVTDDSGNTTLADASKFKFSVTAPTNPQNHGFIRVSKTDSRYFQYDDGKTFIGAGPSVYVGLPASINSQLATIGAGSSNLNRTWMSASNIGGSSWAGWTGNIPGEGNYPGTSMTPNETYGDGLYSLQLPVIKNSAKCVFYGFAQKESSIKSNTNYQISVRLKTVGVSGSGGFTVRPSKDWINSCDQYAATAPVLSYQNGTQDWHEVSTVWNSGSQNTLGYMMLVLENTSGGQVYIDQVSVREKPAAGPLGPEVLNRYNFNVQNYYSQFASYVWDYALDQMAEVGIYQKPVIEEKGDYSFNHIDPVGFATTADGNMGRAASLKYEEYYWRYLVARWGYSRAIHSFEYANEQAPGSLTQANALGQFLRNNDPSKHLATTSFWCCLNGWNTSSSLFPYVDYADTHAYVTWGSDNTSWLGTVDPLTGLSMQTDTAIFSSAHSLDVFNGNKAGSKPIVWGESGVGVNGAKVEENVNDTRGVWYHHYLWAGLNNGGMYNIYWNNQGVNGISAKNLYVLVKFYRSFMEGSSTDQVNKRIPLVNGKYKAAQLTLLAGLRGWGQIDDTNGGAHFWVYDTANTSSTPTGGSSVANKSITLSGLPAKSYIVEFWNTWTGVVTIQNVNHSGGPLTLIVPSTWSEKDVAVKIIPQTGY